MENKLKPCVASPKAKFKKKKCIKDGPNSQKYGNIMYPVHSEAAGFLCNPIYRLAVELPN